MLHMHAHMPLYYRKRLTPQAVKIRADIEVSCFSYDGIDAVKEALINGQKCSTEEMPIKASFSFVSLSSHQLQIVTDLSTNN